VTKFQYKVIRILGVRPEMLEPKLNELGEQGFEFKFANDMLLILSKPVTGIDPSKPEKMKALPTSATNVTNVANKPKQETET
jgi:hypothetical protein